MYDMCGAHAHNSTVWLFIKLEIEINLFIFLLTYLFYFYFIYLLSNIYLFALNSYFLRRGEGIRGLVFYFFHRKNYNQLIFPGLHSCLCLYVNVCLYLCAYMRL